MRARDGESSRLYVRAAMCLVALVLGHTAAPAQTRPPDLRQVSLEDLMDIEVTSASKKEQKLSDVASALFVITRDDIRRSGATSLPEVLRLAPGLEVAHIDANKWAVSSRGFNGRFADKMLVLVDGRSVYTPLFSGVYWDVQDMILADIERIEVIRGPGATIWGANAVNGVINITTKAAQDTQGALVSLRTGGEDRSIAEMRYGWSAGSDAHFRAFAKYVNRAPFASATGGAAADGWDSWRSGARADFQLTPDDSLMVAGQLYTGSAGQTYAPGGPLPFFQQRIDVTAERSGGDVLGRWRRNLSSTANLTVQVYYDRTRRADILLSEERDTIDVEFQHHARVTRRHDMVWGAGYRTTSDDIQNSSTVMFLPASRRDRLFSAYLQDEILLPARVRLTLGTKVEHNGSSDWEFQPNVRALVPVTPRHSLWAAVSRAVRTPSRAEHTVRLETAPIPDPVRGIPALVSLRGTPGFLPETLRAHEAGYRTQFGRASFDAAVFRNHYDHLRTFEPGVPSVTATASGPLIVAPVMFDNGMTGRTSGGELSTSWSVLDPWRIDGTYTYLRVHLERRPGSRDTLGQRVEDDSPRHQLRVSSRLRLTSSLELNTSLQWVDKLAKQQISGYKRLDAALAWDMAPELRLSVGGANLLDRQHPEFGSTLGEMPSEVRRSGYVTIAWRY